ncbi:MAG: tRNA-dihydrouridine synthase family protein [Deltaproteobacteria bacterium]|nr:tRNA-dihydrouridine synthase family protein [Deltaproteobacteria bacterium]
MHDVTDLRFWRLICRYGGADLYFTEYIRVHGTSKPRTSILRAIDDNPTGRPVIAQLIGNDAAALVRTARELQQRPIVGIDFNLGCPAPIVYRKRAGGGLLRDPSRIDHLLGALRAAVSIKLSVKTRLGFDSPAELEPLLAILARHSLDLVTVHGRTVADCYHGQVRYDRIAQAVSSLACPVLANGDIDSAAKAAAVLARTGARGVMIGRAAIRNPWIFDQIRAHREARPAPVPVGRDLLAYLEDLYEASSLSTLPEAKRVQIVKRAMGYVGPGVDADGSFWREVRRARTHAEMFDACRRALSHDRPMALVPVQGLAPPTGVEPVADRD